MSQSHLKHHGPRKRFPDIVIAGAKKCGTTALLFMLTSAHDRIHRMLGDESHFYDRHFDKGLSWYLDKMPIVSDSELVLEKTPNYFTTSFAAKEIQKVSKLFSLQLIKFVFIL